MNSEKFIADTKEKLAQLVNWAFHAVEVDFVIYDGKAYHECSNTWRQREIIYEPHDPDLKCKGYFECEVENEEEALKYLPNDAKEEYLSLLKDKSKFELIKEYPTRAELTIMKKQPDYLETKEKKERYIEIKSNLLRYMRKAICGELKATDVEKFEHVFSIREHFGKWDTVHFPTSAIFYNDMSEINCDHRGSNHLNIDLDPLFQDCVEFRPGDYSIKDFLNRIWLIKGNKFDNNYELFCRITEEDLEDENSIFFDEDDKSWHVHVPVDHGS